MEKCAPNSSILHQNILKESRKINANNGQFYAAKSLSSTFDPVPYQITLASAEAVLAKSSSDMAGAAPWRPAEKRYSILDKDASNSEAQTLKVSFKTAQANLEQT